MKLYEVADEIDKILAEYDIEDAAELEALPEGIKSQLADLAMERDERLANIWALIRNLIAEAGALKSEEQRLAERRHAAERKGEWLREYVADCLGEGNTWQSIDGSRKFCWRKSEAVVVENADAVPDGYCVFERRPLLSEIKKDIRAGATVPGAVLEQRLNLQVR